MNKSHSNISEGSDGKGSLVRNKRNPWSPICEPPDISLLTNSKQGSGGSSNVFDPNGRRIQHNHQQQQTKEDYMPSLISREDVALALAQNGYDDSFIYIPIIAVRRQRIGEEERYHEDPGMIDIAMTLSNHDGSYAIPEDEEYDEFDGNGEEEVDEILGKSKWSASSMLDLLLQTNNGNHHNDIEEDEDEEDERMLSNFPTVIFQHNLPNGFLDTPFATSVLDRFPSKDYVGAPLPEEELPMFCYVSFCHGDCGRIIIFSFPRSIHLIIYYPILYTNSQLVVDYSELDTKTHRSQTTTGLLSKMNVGTTYMFHVYHSWSL